MKYPIYDWRNVIGFASTKAQAERIVTKSLQHIPEGFKITCWLRSDDMCEISKLPKGWVYSIPHK